MLKVIATVGIVVLGVVLGGACKRSTASQNELAGAAATEKVGAAPQRFRDGDLIFQESASSQSEMVRALTGSRWTHMGVVFNEAGATMVFEAVSPVGKTPVKRWIERGRGGRYVVKRLRTADASLPPATLDRMRKLGATWLGRPYDLRFRWDDQSLYCSELVYKLFERGAGVRLGKLQRAAEMNLDDQRVQQALRKRFANAKFDPEELVVTPDSIFNDEQLVEVEP